MPHLLSAVRNSPRGQVDQLKAMRSSLPKMSQQQQRNFFFGGTPIPTATGVGEDRVTRVSTGQPEAGEAGGGRDPLPPAPALPTARGRGSKGWQRPTFHQPQPYQQPEAGEAGGGRDPPSTSPSLTNSQRQGKQGVAETHLPPAPALPTARGRGSKGWQRPTFHQPQRYQQPEAGGGRDPPSTSPSLTNSPQQDKGNIRTSKSLPSNPLAC